MANADRHPAMAAFRDGVKKAVVEGHKEGILAGTDKMGRRLAPLAPSTLKNRKGTGPPLAPQFAAARVISSLQVDWQRASGISVMVAKFVGMDSKAGRPFMQYHMTGAPAVNLPKRDVGGIRPKTWQVLMRLHREMAARILRGTP
jgi:hypothetical protein